MEAEQEFKASLPYTPSGREEQRGRQGGSVGSQLPPNLKAGLYSPRATGGGSQSELPSSTWLWCSVSLSHGHTSGPCSGDSKRARFGGRFFFKCFYSVGLEAPKASCLCLTWRTAQLCAAMLCFSFIKRGFTNAGWHQALFPSKSGVALPRAAAATP